MKIPISMCGPYAADFDGDEMTLFPVADSGALSTTSSIECGSFTWDVDPWTPYKDEYYNELVSSKQKVIDNKTNKSCCFPSTDCLAMPVLLALPGSNSIRADIHILIL